MSATYSYPGIYVQELPLSTHTITPAPTSITAFVGYTHPWKTAVFNTAVQLFSFSDYEANFGGLYTSGLIGADVARAVYAFFLNGGNNAYVVGLQPAALQPGATPPIQFGDQSDNLGYTAMIAPDPASPNVGMLFQALEPADIVPMNATVANLRPVSPPSGPYVLFDLVISYGTRVEVYRSLNLTIPAGQAGSIDKVINGVSTLVTVGPCGGTSYGAFPSAGGGAPPAAPAAATFTLSTLPTMPVAAPPPAFNTSGLSTTFSIQDFLPVFQQNSSLDNVEIFNLLLVPGVADITVLSAALAFAERKRAFTIVDPPQQASAFPIASGPGTGLPGIATLIPTMPVSQNGAIYFPYVKATDPVSGMEMAVAPSGYVAGVYATTDTSRGVWKAPAGIGTPLLGPTGPVASGVMNDMQQGVLNLASINCLRSFASTGTVVYGARTLVSANPAFEQSWYVPVRRMTLFIEQTLVTNLKWVVFEPNDEPLWLAIRSSIESFLLSLFNQQALQGATPSDAFQVKCDATTTTPDDQQAGIVNIVVAVALLKPAEFVVIKIAQLAGQTS